MTAPPGLAAPPAGAHPLLTDRAVPVASEQDPTVASALTELGDHTVAAFFVGSGHQRGAIRERGGDAARRTVRLAIDTGVPILGVLDTSGADVSEGVASLHAWGGLARAVSDASGVVPIVLAVTGPCLSGPALLLGLADIVVMTTDAFAYVSGPDAVQEFTGVAVGRRDLGGASMHGSRSGLAALVVEGEEAALAACSAALDYLPPHHLADLPVYDTGDPPDRRCEDAARAVPDRPGAAYDIRAVVTDVCDHDSFFELWEGHAPNVVTGWALLAGSPVGIVANQPARRAGTLDIDASRKAARFVQLCDAFGVPIATFVDTPGFEPGRDLEWRGMIRHGAQLVHAYAAATVPRVCVVVRKAYGGAYIVMDSKRLGNDGCFAWPTAEIAVMGAPGAVQVLNRRELRETGPQRRAERIAQLEAEFEERFANPYRAAERGYVDAVIHPAETRSVLAATLAALTSKRPRPHHARHSNTPL